MLSFFRRIINSKVGIIVTFIVLGMIALAFGMTDISGIHSGGLSGDTVATVGDAKITATDLRRRVQNRLDNERQQQPTLDMIQFVNGGGVDGTLDQSINTLALDQFGRQQGLVASKRLVDGQIASLPSVRGIDGKFSQAAYTQLLRQLRQTDKQIRGEIATDTIVQHLLVPTFGASQVPVTLALPYASLLLEKRDGQIGFIPTPAMGKGATPTDAEIDAYYKRNIARYTVPERRAVRYAIVTPDRVAASATPTDAEIAKAYQAQRAKFMPTEKRDLVQVVVADQSAANALAAKVKAGTSIGEAARAAGLEPNMLTGVEKAGYAAQSTAAIADAAFGAAKGAVVGPLSSPLGYVVVRVNGITQVAGKSLEQARPELVKALTAEKSQAAMANLRESVDEAIGNSATFDEIVADQKLDPKQTPPLTAAGANPEDAASQPDPALGQVVAAGFAAEEGDDPQIVAYGEDGGFAVVALARIVPAAPRKPAEIHDALVHDFVIDRAERAARKVAVDVVAQVNKGVPLAKALADTKLRIPPPQTVPTISREQLKAAQGQVPAPIVLLFSMAEKHARMVEAPNKSGWLVVYLNHIERGSAKDNKQLIDMTRADLGKVTGGEYVQQFSAAVRQVVGVKKDAKAIDAIKATLTGQGGSN